MAGVTKEEIAWAKELDLLTYFKLVEPGNLKLVGKEYRHKVHSSLTISKDSLWCWHCIGLRGRTALKYLIDVEKVPYVEAVREINRISKCQPVRYLSDFTVFGRLSAGRRRTDAERNWARGAATKP